MKKYLTKPEEILALKDTDTKIYTEGLKEYYQFVQGTLCQFAYDGSVTLFSGLVIGSGFFNRYILVEEPVKEADENDIGYLCHFYENNFIDLSLGVLDEIDETGRYVRKGGSRWKHCHRLTPAEVAEITGYKVEA